VDNIKLLRTKATEEYRADMATAVNKFMTQKNAMNGLLSKMSSTDMPMAQEIGRNAVMISSRALEQAKEQGVDMPASAAWSIPADQKDVGGAVATAINNQIAMGKAAGLISDEDESQLIQESFMYSVMEGQRDPNLAEGAGALAEKMNEQGADPVKDGGARGILKELESDPKGILALNGVTGSQAGDTMSGSLPEGGASGLLDQLMGGR